MNGVKRQVIVLSLIEKMEGYGNWCGETHIQKNLYFLQEMLGVPTNYDFILYKHGPFSFDLRDEVYEMRANMILDLRSNYPYGPSHFPGQSSQKLKQLYPKTAIKYENQIEFIARELCDSGVAQLERLATALYVTLEEGKDRPVDYRARKINELKPHVKINEATAAVEKVDLLMEQVKELNH